MRREYEKKSFDTVVDGCDVHGTVRLRWGSGEGQHHDR